MQAGIADNESDRVLLPADTSQSKFPALNTVQDRECGKDLVEYGLSIILSPSAPADSKSCLNYGLCSKVKTIACLCTFFLQFWNATRLDHRLRDDVCEPHHTIRLNKIMNLVRTTRRSDQCASPDRCCTAVQWPLSMDKEKETLCSNWGGGRSILTVKRMLRPSVVADESNGFVYWN